MTAMAATTNPDISQREIDHKTAAKNIAKDRAWSLMENKNNSLPISAKKGTKSSTVRTGRLQYHQRRYRFRCSKPA